MEALYQLPPDAKAGTIYLSKNLDTLKDIVVSFDYACYGSNPVGSEGFCVFFYNTFAKFLSGGGPGPGLCYTPVFGISAFRPDGTIDYNYDGVARGQLGVGFDLTGNFATSGFGPDGLGDYIPNSIAIRGSENYGYKLYYRSEDLAGPTFAKPISLYQQITGSEDPTFTTVRVRLTDFCQHIYIDYKDPVTNKFVNYVEQYLPESVVPPSMNCCLSFASGLTSTCFSVRNLSINGSFTSVSAIPITFSWTYTGAAYLGLLPTHATLTVRDTITIQNAPPYQNTPPLIFVSQDGAAPFQNSDGYININYLNT
jgi:hypothetical protein